MAQAQSKPQPIKLPGNLVKMAQVAARIEHRTPPKQIELWAEIGRAVLENPDLPTQFVIDSLKSIKQAEEGLVEPYEFG